MIIVKNRKLIIPPEDRILGTSYDGSSGFRMFSVDRYAQEEIDISGLAMKADLKYEDGSKDTADLSIEIAADKIFLTLVLSSSIMQHEGTVLINLRGTTADGKIRWASLMGAFYIEQAINTPSDYTGEITELEQIEARINDALLNITTRTDAAIGTIEDKLYAVDDVLRTKGAEADAATNRANTAADEAESIAESLLTVSTDLSRAVNRANAASGEAEGYVDYIRGLIESGQLIGQKGDRGDTGLQGPQGERGPAGQTGQTGPAGPTGPKGDTGESGVMTPVNGFVTFSVDDDGYLCVTATDSTTAAAFSVSADGYLEYEV